MKTILLITEEYDPTADNLVQLLARRGYPALRWNLNRYPLGSSLTYRASERGFDGEISAYGRTTPFEQIGSVWYRALRARGFPKPLSPQEHKFAAQEAEITFESLASVTPWAWINDPCRHREASRKPEQLFVARRLGFAVPRTLISNDPERIEAFRTEVGGSIIYKTLSQPYDLERGKTAFTGLVGERELAQLHLIRNTPGIFQELVPKAYEIRATIVGDRIFAAKILSQDNDKTKLDWRLAPYEVRYEPVELPSEIDEKIARFMSEEGLLYSCLDFIVTPDGRHVFLESNPRGQYLWIEHFTGLPITEALADTLKAAQDIGGRPRARSAGTDPRSAHDGSAALAAQDAPDRPGLEYDKN